MGKYVEDGNSCIGCQCLPAFPSNCGACRNLKPVTTLIEEASAREEKRDRLYKQEQKRRGAIQVRVGQALQSARYWRDIDICSCKSTLPTGGCLRCEMKAVEDTIMTMSDLLGIHCG